MHAEAEGELAHFAAGLIHLMHDEFAGAAQYLSSGIELNTNNRALNVDMQRILAEIQKMRSADAGEQNGPDASSSDSASHIFISAYTGSRNN